MLFKAWEFESDKENCKVHKKNLMHGQMDRAIGAKTAAILPAIFKQHIARPQHE